VKEHCDPDWIAQQILIRKLIGTALVRLDARSQWVIVARFGLDGERPWTLKECAAAASVTRERIRQIEFKALARLRTILKVKPPMLE